MQLKKILEIHEQTTTPNSIPDSFGDGYLLKNNLVYSNIRTKAIQLGYKFSSTQFAAYEALTLAQIGKVIEQKIIPYVASIAPLNEILSQSKYEFRWDEIPDLKLNPLFHETAHVVARSCTNSLKSNDAENRKALSLLLEESFANACEAYASLLRTDDAHRIFYSVNSFFDVDLDSDIFKNLKNAHELLGAEKLFTLLILSYLHANFLWDNFSKPTLDRILKITLKEESLNEDALEIIWSGLECAFLLNDSFRTKTNDFYFRFLGLSKPIDQLLDFDHLDLLESEPGYMQSVKAMVRAALN